MENTYVFKYKYKRQKRHFLEGRKPKKRTAYLLGQADNNLNKKSFNWVERSPQGSWKDVRKLRNN